MAVLKEYYKDLSVEELMMDDFFIESMERPNEDTEAFWKDVLLQYPQRKNTLEEARRLVLSLNFQQAIPRPGAKEAVWNAIISTSEKNAKQPIIINVNRWLWSAASVILILVIGGIMWWQYAGNSNLSLAGGTKKLYEIPPGKNGAILTLTDGKQVVLDSMGNGLIASQNGSQVVLKSGSLIYNTTEMSSADVAYNTMTTPKGRQFNLTLPDGTGVWLNAASAIKYPTSFNGKERKVEIHGEVYFEVARNEKMPFKVKVNKDLEVEVLGTHFNINAYNEDACIKTTLLEGSVRLLVDPSNSSLASSHLSKPTIVLKPGQQAQITSVDPPKIITDVDMTNVMAWKNGLFDFEDVGLQEVMRQLSRWYDIEVVYNGRVPDIQFGGKMSRNITLSGVLKILEKTGVHFRMEEGRRLIVLSE